MGPTLLITMVISTTWFSQTSSLNTNILWTMLFIPSLLSHHAYHQAVIHSYPNQSPWANLDLDNDSEWIVGGMAQGSQSSIHNGSFMEALDPSSCSAGGTIFYQEVQHMPTFMAAEHTDHHMAINYTGELMGWITYSSNFESDTFSPFQPYTPWCHCLWQHGGCDPHTCLIPCFHILTSLNF